MCVLIKNKKFRNAPVGKSSFEKLTPKSNLQKEVDSSRPK